MYAKMVSMVRARGVGVPNTCDSGQVEGLAKPILGAASGELREAYLPARYGSRPVSREDIKKARESYKNLNRK
jgi:hypothetical protein